MSHSSTTLESSSLLVRDALGEYRQATADEVMTAARGVLSRRVRRGTEFTSPQLSRDYLRVKLGTLEHEAFMVVLLDARHRLIEALQMFRGTIDSTSVYPREVVKEALARNASAVILAHNHPSGAAEPSRADELITRRLREALALIDVRVLDHLFVAGEDVVSFAERGLL